VEFRRKTIFRGKLKIALHLLHQDVTRTASLDGQAEKRMKKRIFIISCISAFFLFMVLVWIFFIGGPEEVSNCVKAVKTNTNQLATTSCSQMSPEQQALLDKWKKEHPQPTACPIISSVKQIPFRDKRGIDEAYDRLRYDDACEEVLRAALLSLVPMHDPRQVPPDNRVVEGDAALFLLVDKHDLDISQLLPDEQKPNWESRGMTAYFDYVSSYENRVLLVKRLNEQLVSSKSAQPK